MVAGILYHVNRLLPGIRMDCGKDFKSARASKSWKSKALRGNGRFSDSTEVPAHAALSLLIFSMTCPLTSTGDLPTREAMLPTVYVWLAPGLINSTDPRLEYLFDP
jgi:hypothetical protein